MSTKIKDGGTAFPVTDADAQGVPVCVEFGMSLRDYFAAKAMQLVEREWDTSHDGQLLAIASLCYQIADAMLRAREVQP